MRGVYYSACSLCYKTIAQFHQKCLLMRDCLLFRRLLLPESTVLAPLGISDLPTALGREENLDKIPNGNTFLALACLDLVKTFIATLLRFVILANSKQA